MLFHKKYKTNKAKLFWWCLLIFALCFIIISYPDLSKGVFAFAQEHKGRQNQDEAAWQNIRGGALSYGSFSEALESVAAGGTVILRSDVTLTEGITVSKSITITSWNAAAPCTIKNMTNDTDDKRDVGRIFTVSGCQVILQNVILDGGRNDGIIAHHPLICIDNGGVLRILGGCMLQNNENVSQNLCGGGVTVRIGQFYMYDDSVITNCKARHGGGVYINGKNSNYQYAAFGIAGGKIENCEADHGGGILIIIVLTCCTILLVIQNSGSSIGTAQKLHLFVQPRLI